MNDILKKYGIISTIVVALGLGSYVSGLKPVFAYELAQTNDKLDNFACLQIIFEYEKAKQAGNAKMMAILIQQAQAFNCSLPS